RGPGTPRRQRLATRSVNGPVWPPAPTGARRGLLQVRRELRQRLEVGRVMLDHHPRLAVAGDLLDGSIDARVSPRLTLPTARSCAACASIRPFTQSQFQVLAAQCAL